MGVGVLGLDAGSNGSSDRRGVNLSSSCTTVGALGAIGLELGEFEVLRRFGARASGEWPDASSVELPGTMSSPGTALAGRVTVP